MTSSATEKDIVNLLGDADAFIIERIIDTHATAEEVAEALAAVEDERRFGERRAPASPRVAEVRGILEEVLDEPDDDESR
jgi:hypothetical protein